MSVHILRLLSRFLAIAWTIVLTVMLLQAELKPLIPTGIPPAPPSIERELLFSLLHVIAFGLLFGLWVLSFIEQVPLKRLLLVCFICLLLYGIGIELIQAQSAAGRSAQITDILANGLGMGLAAYGYIYFFSRFNQKQLA